MNTVPVADAGEAAKISSPRPITTIRDGDEVFGLRIVATPGHTDGPPSAVRSPRVPPPRS
ncbi:MAG: MBL fold metallo-hydrolase [Actinomycetales bacterium]|nr:MBL fold metallo-hydrolase [Actinomycetales bacterium]